MKILSLIALLGALLVPVHAELAPTKTKPKSPSKTKTVPKKKSPKKAKAAPKARPKAAPKAAPKTKPKTKPKAAPKAKPKAAPKSRPAAKKSGSHISAATPELKKKAAGWVKALPAAKRSKLLKVLNKGSEKEVQEIPGIGATRYQNLKKGRPFKSVEDLANISGFGEKTFKSVIDHAKKMK